MQHLFEVSCCASSLVLSDGARRQRPANAYVVTKLAEIQLHRYAILSHGARRQRSANASIVTRMAEIQ